VSVWVQLVEEAARSPDGRDPDSYRAATDEGRDGWMRDAWKRLLGCRTTETKSIKDERTRDPRSAVEEAARSPDDRDVNNALVQRLLGCLTIETQVPVRDRRLRPSRAPDPDAQLWKRLLGRLTTETPSRASRKRLLGHLMTETRVQARGAKACFEPGGGGGDCSVA
jgi:hypothetical protein